MRGGDLHWIWSPYALYQEVDWMYGVKALKENNGFTSGQALMNLIETFLNFVYVYQVHIDPTPAAPLVGIVAATMTLSKTVLYWVQEGFCGLCNIGHNTLFDVTLLWIVPNGIWLVVPSFVIWRLWKDISSALKVASEKSVKVQ